MRMARNLKKESKGCVTIMLSVYLVILKTYKSGKVTGLSYTDMIFNSTLLKNFRHGNNSVSEIQNF